MQENNESNGLHAQTVQEAIDLLTQIHGKLEEHDYETAQALINVAKLMVDFLHRDLEVYVQISQMLKRQLNSGGYNPHFDR